MMNDVDGTRIAIGRAGKVMGKADGVRAKAGPGPIMRDLSPRRTMIALGMARITTEGSAKAVMARATAGVDSLGNIIATAVTEADMAGKPGAAGVREKAGRPAAMTPVTAAAAITSAAGGTVQAMRYRPGWAMKRRSVAAAWITHAAVIMAKARADIRAPTTVFARTSMIG
jgi:hypothetical protein